MTGKRKKDKLKQDKHQKHQKHQKQAHEKKLKDEELGKIHGGGWLQVAVPEMGPQMGYPLLEKYF
jgi:hypothetical protein